MAKEDIKKENVGDGGGPVSGADPSGRDSAHSIHSLKEPAQSADGLAMTVSQIEMLVARIETELQTFMAQEEVNVNLTAKDRRRLIGAQVRNNGFIDKAFDIAHENPDFMPPNFNLATLTASERRFEMLRQLTFVLEQFQQMASDAFLVQSDFCYREALRIYNSLGEQTKGRVPGAEPLFNALRNFFHRRRRTTDEPTEIQIERDVKAVIHGKKDGEIVLRNESPHMVGGLHEAIDDVRSGRSAFKESAQGEVKE